MENLPWVLLAIVLALIASLAVEIVRKATPECQRAPSLTIQASGRLCEGKGQEHWHTTLAPCAHVLPLPGSVPR
jgi:hypothetical protein